MSASLPMALGTSGTAKASVHIGPWGECVVFLDHSGLDQACGPTSATRQLAAFDSGLGGVPMVGVTRADVAFSS